MSVQLPGCKTSLEGVQFVAQLTRSRTNTYFQTDLPESNKGEKVFPFFTLWGCGFDICAGEKSTLFFGGDKHESPVFGLFTTTALMFGSHNSHGGSLRG